MQMQPGGKQHSARKSSHTLNQEVTCHNFKTVGDFVQILISITYVCMYVLPVC